jgi:hypothetical protein
MRKWRGERRAAGVDMMNNFAKVNSVFAAVRLVPGRVPLNPYHFACLPHLSTTSYSIPLELGCNHPLLLFLEEIRV